jgi:dihydrofolate synthase / folylpolyglutamate synthase
VTASLPHPHRRDDAGYARYTASLDALFQRTGGVWRLGLDHVREFLSRLGDPHLAVPVFHVAGTNGKGSTVATLDALLRQAGYRVGRYMSPHLVDFTERIVVDGEAIPRAKVATFLEEWAEVADLTGATFFEVTTALAFAYFREMRVTSIGFDHMAYLGDTLPAIASEKAGIFKVGAPAVIGEHDLSISELLAARARAIGAEPVVRAGVDWLVDGVLVDGSGTHFTRRRGGRSMALSTPLVGAVQAGNACTALAMLEAAGGPWASVAAAAPTSLHAVRLAGRFQRVGPWVFDVAHNPDGVRVLLDTVRSAGLPTPLVAVVSVLRDKDWRAMLDALGPAVTSLILTIAPTAPASRVWELSEVTSYVRSRGWTHLVAEDFAGALDTGRAAGATVLVTGSFHTVGDAMDRLQVDPLAP